MLRTGFLKRKNGQAVVEYFVFFAVITVLTLLSVCTLYPLMNQACRGMFQDAVEIDYMHSEG